MRRELPGPGQESVWDYPRPPRLERTIRRIRIEFGGVTIVDTTSAWRVLETSHPPNYYIPPNAFSGCELVISARTSFCEWKGQARYASIRVGDLVADDAAWSYPDPVRAFAPLAGFFAVYPDRMDRCLVDDEVVTPQPGGFYGGWITADVVGPFKGGPGTSGW